MTCQEGSASGRLKDGDASGSQEGSGAGTAGPAAAAAEKHPRCTTDGQDSESGGRKAAAREGCIGDTKATGGGGDGKGPCLQTRWIIDVMTSEATIKPIIDAWTPETAHTILGDPTQKQALPREQLCNHMTQLVHAATAHRQQNAVVKRAKRWSGLDIDKTVLTEDENMDPN